jgi:hypothetical protein
MAKKKFTKNSPEWNMLGDLFHIAEDNWLPEASESYWKHLSNDIQECINKYDHLSPVVKEIGIGMLTGLQKKYDNDNDYNKQMEMFGGK